jgi:DnaK suppressor protein
MDKDFLEKQKARLESEKTEIQKEIKNITDGGKLSSHFRVRYPQLGDSEEDNAEEVEEYIENLDLEGHLEDILKNIDEALKRIKNGTYGICEKCGKKIDRARLEVYPAANLCVDDQSRQEKRQISH